MDFFKSNTKLIGGAVVGLLGVASLVYLYRKYNPKETASFTFPLSGLPKYEFFEIQGVQQVQQRIAKKIKAEPKVSIEDLEQSIAKQIQQYMFKRTSNIELLKHQKCFQSFKKLKGSDFIKKVILIIRESATSLDCLEKETQQLITKIPQHGLSSASIESIVQKISNLQDSQDERISKEYKELARQYLKAKNVYISKLQNKNEITTLLTESGFIWDEGSLKDYPTIVSILIDVHVFDQQKNFSEKNFQISLAIEKGSISQFNEQLKQWNKAIEPFEAIFQKLQKNK